MPAYEMRISDWSSEVCPSDLAERRLDRLLHHVAQLPGRPDRPLAGHRHRFHGQQFAAHLGPRQAGRRADLVLLLADAEAELADPRIVAAVGGRDDDLVRLSLQD